jgi:hypothetical protein
LKISDTNQQINNKPELPKVDSTDSLAGGKKTEQKSKTSVTVTGSSAIKSDTVQLSPESLALANSDKAKSNAGEKTQTKGIHKIINESSLVELLKKADEQSGLFGPGKGISRAEEQEDADSKSSPKIDFLL